MTENEFERQAEITIRRYLAIRKSLGSQVSSEAAALLTVATYANHVLMWLTKPVDVRICDCVNPHFGVKCTRESGHTGGHYFVAADDSSASVAWEDMIVPINYLAQTSYRCEPCGVTLRFATPPTNPDIETRCPKCSGLMACVTT